MTGPELPTSLSSGLTLRDLFAGKLKRFGSRDAVISGNHELSYRQLDETAARVAAGLQSLGVGPGTAVALLLGNCVEYLVADQAIMRLGAIKVPVNRLLSADEAQFILSDSDAKVAIADDHHIDVTMAGHTRLDHVVAVHANRSGTIPWSDLSNTHPPETLTLPAIHPDDPATIHYTGGTTGQSKGVLHTQGAIATNLLAQLIEIGLLDDECLLLNTPLVHAAGPLAQIGLLKGAIIYLEDRFDADTVLTLLEDRGITFTFMVPTMIYRLLDRLRDRPAQTATLRTLLYGAAPITRERLEEGMRRLGPVFMQLYGQTEAPNFITRLTREDHMSDAPERLTSCGRPAVLMDVAILDDTGERLPAGSVGEVCARGPYLMSGYHNLPDRSAEAIRGGWLCTGDIGYLDDDSYLYLLDRKKDMVISGGMNVYCAEVESVLRTCPGIAEVAVVGVADVDWGEAVVAVVVGDDSRFNEADAEEHCRQQLGGYKRPKYYVLVDELPLTSLGKVDKAALRDSLTLTPHTSAGVTGL